MKCPCFYYEQDPEQPRPWDIFVCACGHVDDEHDEHGECQAELIEEE